MAGGKFITRWLLLAIFLVILFVYFLFYAPDIAHIPSYNDYLSHSHHVDHLPMNEPMVESDIGLGHRLLPGAPTATEDSTLITLEAIEIKPTRLMPVRPVRTGEVDLDLDIDSGMDDSFDEDPHARLPGLDKDDDSATVATTSTTSTTSAVAATAKGDELARDILTPTTEITNTSKTTGAAAATAT